MTDTGTRENTLKVITLAACSYIQEDYENDPGEGVTFGLWQKAIEIIADGDEEQITNFTGKLNAACCDFSSEDEGADEINEVNDLTAAIAEILGTAADESETPENRKTMLRVAIALGIRANAGTLLTEQLATAFNV